MAGENKVKNYGFVQPFIKEDAWVLGAVGELPEEVLVPDGDWKPWRTSGEIQRNEIFDTFNCTGYGTAKMIRTYMKRKFGIDFNPSERWIGIIAGTRPPGNDPHKVMEAIREHGLIPESMLPFDDLIRTIEDYYSFKGANENECREEAKRWHNTYDFLHQYLFYPTADPAYKAKQLKENLTKSPPGVSVLAWKQNEKGLYYKERGEIDTHWTEMEAEMWRIFDSYPEFEKKLEANYDFGFAKRIWIGLKKKDAPSKTSYWRRFLEFLKRIFS